MGITEPVQIGARLELGPYSDVLQNYSRDQEEFEKTLMTDPTALLEELKIAFGHEFDSRSDIGEQRAFDEMLIPEDALGSYIMRAVLASSKDVINRTILRPVLSQGNPRVSYGLAREESGMTYWLQASTTAKNIRRRIRDMRMAVPLTKDTFKQDPAQVRKDLVAYFEKVVAPAAAMESPIVKPTMKLYAMAHSKA